MERADGQPGLDWATRWLAFGDAADRALATSGPRALAEPGSIDS
jgi:hypothetical protein